MDKDLLLKALKAKYTQPGKHLAQVYDDPVFARLPLDVQHRFLEDNKASFESGVWPVAARSSLTTAPMMFALGGMLPAGLATYKTFATKFLYSHPELHKHLSIDAAGNMSPDLMGSLGKVLPAFFKSPAFWKAAAIAGGATAALYGLSTLTAATRLHNRRMAYLNGASPEESLINSYGARPSFPDSGILPDTAKTFLQQASRDAIAAAPINVLKN